MTLNGSRRGFQYTSDSGLTCAVELDESTYENAALGFSAIDTGAGGPLVNLRYIQVSASKPLTMRYVNCVGSNASGETVRKRFYVGSPTADIFTGAVLSFDSDGTTWSVTSTRGEQRSQIPVNDTGQTDGDSESNFA